MWILKQTAYTIFINPAINCPSILKPLINNPSPKLKSLVDIDKE